LRAHSFGEVGADDLHFWGAGAEEEHLEGFTQIVVVHLVGADSVQFDWR
jgi:hypothetical protein